MRKILLLAAVVLCLCSCGKNEESGYRIEVKFGGDLSALLSDTVILRSEYFTDTLVVVDDSVCFEGRIQTPSEVYLLGKTKAGYPLARFFLENCENKATISISRTGMTHAVVKGGRYLAVEDSLYGIRKKFIYDNDFLKITDAISTCTDPVEKAKLQRAVTNLRWRADSVFAAVEANYVAENPLSLYALMNTLKNIESLSETELEARIAAFKAVPEYSENLKLKQIEQAAAQLKAVRVGNKVADFTQNDPQGNPVKFSDVYSKNKLTMVDFWASWCGPCRAFNPTLMKIYEKYHDKGFEVLGVSYDSNKDAWVKCIESEKLPWPQVSDLKGWANATSDMFYIKGIPQNLFVDQNGTIVGYKVNRNTIEQFIKEQLEK